MTQKIARVVSACHAKQAGIWKISSREIPRKIPASCYELVCPDRDAAGFSGCTGPEWVISPDSKYLDGHDIAFFEGFKIHKGGVGWYVQQIVKIRAAAAPDLADEDIVLIWDSDTVPLRPLRFVDADGRLLYFRARENQAPYFRTMERLAGIPKVEKNSFVAQCIPSRAGWVRGLIAEVESRAGMPFSEALFSTLEGLGEAEFSEYETLGNYALSRHPGGMGPANIPWERNGALLASPETAPRLLLVLLKLLSLRFAHVSFESWQKPSLSGGLGVLSRLAGLRE